MVAMRRLHPESRQYDKKPWKLRHFFLAHTKNILFHPVRRLRRKILRTNLTPEFDVKYNWCFENVAKMLQHFLEPGWIDRQPSNHQHFFVKHTKNILFHPTRRPRRKIVCEISALNSYLQFNWLFKKMDARPPSVTPQNW